MFDFDVVTGPTQPPQPQAGESAPPAAPAPDATIQNARRPEPMQAS